MHLRRYIAVIALVLVCLPVLSQDFVPPRLTVYATDLTGTLSPGDLADLNARLRAFDDSTSTQVVFLMVPTIGNYAVEEAALKVAEENKIGRKGRDNGVLLFVAQDDRAIRIEVGYGLEGVLPDIICGQIIRNEIIPAFRAGDYSGGIHAGLQSIMLAVRNEYTADEKSGKKGGGFGFLIFVAIMVFFFIFMRRRGGPFSGSGPMGGRGGGPFIFIPPIGGGWGGRRGSGGGFGGFGGGGFSGGGGSFGGGGASGHW